MIRSYFLLFVLLLDFVPAFGDSLDLGSRRELFVDDFLIETLDGAELKLHSPQPANIALSLDRPWEGLFCGYFTVFQDGDRYRMYYRGLPDVDRADAEVTCMAESSDGIHWERPNLGLYEINGTRENNVILRGEGTHNFAPFLDTHPDVPKEQKYKALGSVDGGLAAFDSADGIHWKKWHEKPVLTHDRHGEFDSQNVPFWSETEGCYVCYFRKFVDGVRSIRRATSDDFIQWSDAQPLSYRVPFAHANEYTIRLPNGDIVNTTTPAEHLYTNQTHPYFHAPHIYIAFPMRFMPERRVLNENQAGATGVHAKYGSDAADGVFMSIRGNSSCYTRFMEGFFRPGPDPGNWVSRTNMAAQGVVPTGETEMSIYYSQHYAQPSHHLLRCTLRTDGFVSVNGPYSGGLMTTKPFRFKGNRLVMNYSASAAGMMQVELQNQEGQPIAGYAMDDCVPLFGDTIEGTVAWKGGPDVSHLSGQTVRMKVYLKDADLYSLRFVP
ncbi:MAG TPA: hypothetical protein PLQ35_01055 [bacterium]|nr:hypothetical protein [bacterium]HQL60859.1 hypothetical protein [bacterium]